MRDDGQLRLACPECEAPAGQLIGHEVRGVYDGVLFWSCGACGHIWNRWPFGHHLWEKAEKIVNLRREEQRVITS